MITLDQFKACFPNNQDAPPWTAALNVAMEKYHINTPMRVAAFLAQCGHESAGFTATTENLNYSAEALMKVFHKYFPNPKIAAEYARQPQKIANKVYANRMGNGDEASGDGWLYRGRGPIQITGKDNHSAFVKATGFGFGWILTIEGGAESAAWFWGTHKLNTLADKGDMLAITKVINGGTNGLADRLQRYEHIKEVLGV